MTASQALVYAILAEAEHDRRNNNAARSRHAKRSLILPDFLG